MKYKLLNLFFFSVVIRNKTGLQPVSRTCETTSFGLQKKERKREKEKKEENTRQSEKSDSLKNQTVWKTRRVVHTKHRIYTIFIVKFASYIFHYDYCNKSFLQFTLKVSKERFSQSVPIFPFRYQSWLDRAFIPTFLLFVM